MTAFDSMFVPERRKREPRKTLRDDNVPICINNAFMLFSYHRPDKKNISKLNQHFQRIFTPKARLCPVVLVLDYKICKI